MTRSESSLKKTSANTGLLRAAVKIGHPNLKFEWADVSDFPLFNEDVEAKGVPACVERVKKQAATSDAILFGCPENNCTVSAVLKNAYDWVTRGGSLKGLPIGAVSAAGPSGGSKSQENLAQVVGYYEMQLMKDPKVQVNRYVPGNFDEQGDVVSEEVKEHIKKYLEAFAHWVHFHKTSKK